ncbi:MAG: hypothetical protein E6357_30745 [Clostridiales bacterium]|nr:hypothetical protein [Clostridiales bacterium]
MINYNFKVGQTAYIELTGNASRGKKPNSEELIKQCTVTSVGRKYVIADGKKYKEHDFSYVGLIEHTEYCMDSVLYPNKKDILDKFEKENLINSCKRVFEGFGKCVASEFSLDKLRNIKKMIDD